MKFSSYSNYYKEKKKLSHPALIKWIKEERKNQLPPPPKTTTKNNREDGDDLCRKCFPNGLQDDKENVLKEEELNDSKRFVFIGGLQQRIDGPNNLNRSEFDFQRILKKHRNNILII